MSRPPQRSPRSRRAMLAGVAALACVAALAGPALPAAAAPSGPLPFSAGRVTLAPYVVEWSRLAGQGGNATADLGPAAAGAPVSARVYLAGRDPAGLARYAASVSDPGSRSFHHYLTPAQVRDRFGATGSQVAAIRSWLAASGLKITGVAEHDIAVSGTAAAAQAAFGAVWHSYEVDGTTQQAPPPAAQLSAPARVGPAVLTVAPVETGLPGYPATAPATVRPASGPSTTSGGSAAATLKRSGPLTTAAPAAAGPGCSSYYGQNLAASLPSAYGRTVPYYLCGYPPAQLRSAYGVPRTLTGKGITVAVVHPWRQFTAAQDLATFGARHGEPLRPGQFTQILPSGLDASCEGTTQGPFPLANEETGDVELVHATAPDARIVYVGAKCDDGEGTVQDLDALTTIVDQRLATIVSNSWGAVASDALLSAGLVDSYEQIFEQGAVEGIGFYFAAGDGGEYSGGGSPGDPPTLIYPQSDPWVTSVGGTSLAAGRAGSYKWETGWGDLFAEPTADGTGWAGLPGTFFEGSGGGTSTLFRQPFYQRGVVPAALSHASRSAGPMRVVPDIAADADPFTGPLVGETISPGPGQPATYQEGPGGGTSVATPAIAGIQADAQQLAGGAPIGFANPAIYARYGTRAYHDVTDQPLGPGFTPAVALPAGLVATVPVLITLGMDEGLAATRGYDDVTGVGTPDPGYFASYRGAPG
ncbi:MAG TPA: S53 family peptidase [Streptosporangiaceae bacterium]|nr:S53 family peptidase [Streptosporangiaceae bacterium]